MDNRSKPEQETTDSAPHLAQYAQSETGAVRESIGKKIKTHLVPYELIIAAAVGLNYGEEKYEARNFEKGLSETDLLMSIERHLRALMDKEVEDEDTELPHEYLLCSSVAMFVACKMRGTIIEDLPRPPMRKGLSIATISAKAQSDLAASLAHLASKRRKALD